MSNGPKGWRLVVGTALHVGRARSTRPNEDSLGTDIPPWPIRRPPLLVVADGMGGHWGGAVASRLVVERVIHHFRRNHRGPDALHALDRSIRAAHRALRDRAHGDPANLGAMGSTIVAASLVTDRAHVANVGDSRAYLIHNGRLTQISHDHSHVADLERAGLLAAGAGRADPRRNQLTMSLSAQRESIEVYLKSVAVEPGDALILCSDGLWGTVADAEIESVAAELEPRAAAHKLVSLANLSQGPDNIAVIVARLTPQRDLFHRARLATPQPEDTNP